MELPAEAGPSNWQAVDSPVRTDRRSRSRTVSPSERSPKRPRLTANPDAHDPFLIGGNLSAGHPTAGLSSVQASGPSAAIDRASASLEVPSSFPHEVPPALSQAIRVGYYSCRTSGGLASADSPALEPLVNSLEQQDVIRSSRHAINLDTVLVRVYMIPDRKGKGKAVSRSVAQQRGESLVQLLRGLHRDRQGWDGQSLPAARKEPTPVLDPTLTTDYRTLPELYSALPSPNPAVGSLRGSRQARAFVEEILSDGWEGPRGLAASTKLHGYQIRTVQQLIVQELLPAQIVSPAHIPLLDVDSKHYYLLVSSAIVTREPPTFEGPRGGILCEEMGAGKTLQTLSLILATLSHLPTPPLSLPTRTSFPTPTQGVRSLEELCRSVLRSDPICARHVLSLDDLEGVEGQLLRRISEEKRRCWYEIEGGASGSAVTVDQEDMGVGSGRGRRGHKVQPLGEEGVGAGDGAGRSGRVMKRVWLGWGTLVTVPDNLLRQWEQMIAKHLEPGALRILVVRSGDRLPDSEVLAFDYDLVLMPHSRFSAEDAHKDRDGHTSSVPRECRCTIPDGGNQVLCRCAKPDEPSPLLGLRWKRFVVDEGQVASGKWTMLVGLARALNVERIWVVSGTPTPNLTSELASVTCSDKTRTPSTPSASSSALTPPISPQPSASPNSHVLPPPTSPRKSSPSKKRKTSFQPLPTPRTSPSPYAWPPQFEEDLKKLGAIMIGFLRLGAFGHEKTRTGATKSADVAWKEQVVAPLRIGSGLEPEVGAVARVQLLMKTFMVRHRTEDLTHLPPLTHSVKTIELEPAGRMTYNVLQAFVNINNVSAQRTGQDWLFHPSNSGRVTELLLNISYSLFWHTSAPDVSTSSSFLDPLPSTLSSSPSSILTSKTSASPIKKSQPKSIPSPIFHSLVSQTADAVEIARKDLARGRPSDPTDPPFTPEDLSLLHESIVCLETALADETWLALQGGKCGASLPFPVRGVGEEVEVPRGIGLTVDGARYFVPSEVELLRKTLSREEVGAEVVLEKTQSAKLNFVLSEIVAHADEKFIIFSNDVVALARTLEALDGISIVSVYVSSAVKDRKERDRLLTRFKEEVIVRVLLMELKFGARGLDLPCASRIIFTEPCWSRDIELQALKRAHRQGQTRPVVAYTLIARGTNEEEQYNLLRSNATPLGQGKAVAKTTGMSQTTSSLKDPKLRDLLQHPKFVQALDPGADGRGESVTLEVALWAARPVVVEADAEEGVDVQEPLAKKKKATGGVRFAN